MEGERAREIDGEEGARMALHPSRSDVHLLPEEAARVARETREYFEGIAPRRHTKPQRSEYSDQYSDAVPASDQGAIPELDRLRDLEAYQQKLVCEGSEPADEYVETEYYKDLNCIDKQHHMTGTGFIRMEKSNGRSLNLTSADATTAFHVTCKGNPATNEWIPSSDVVIPTSHKPNRSDA